ncbi:hypothetical protein Slit_1098 [Sideroxydans lithotrophicus ES-1]|uniref:Uncharacterized protein n=1 Tax=Sideroxydans lithotrophicus (strain ES-1) TaxID=580332 RepID=D5CQV0_SIDLE|nr:hypothetical protein Slit_1098 [Sideroxydans lithotrophicus ES-1]
MTHSHDDNELTQAINEMIPKSLDDIIRANRHLCILTLSTEGQLGELPPIVQSLRNPKAINATLSDWRFICLNLSKEHGGSQHILTGYHEVQGCCWSTSVIVAADLEHGLVLTRSGSIYRLGTKGEAEPGQDMLLHICVQLHKWGMGTLFGVPHVFY